jgi:CRISPR-associated exonuclease Cas4
MNNAPFYFAAAVVLLVVAGRVFLTALRSRAGVPPGRVLYCDTGGRETKVLVSALYQLKGKPDYVLDVANGVVPVEIKSGRRPPGGDAHLGHVMQLAAYCVLCEEHFHRPVPYGVVKYSDGAVRVPFTPALRRDLRDLLEEMRRAGRGGMRRNHSQPRRCATCSFVGACDEAI